MTDLSQIKPASERIVEILHPGTEQPLGIKVGLCSIDDEDMKRVKRRMQDAALVLQRRGKGFSSAQIDTNRNEIAFSAMRNWTWEGDTTFHGEKPAFNQANVYAVFNELPWFRDQIEEEISETKSFFQT